MVNRVDPTKSIPSAAQTLPWESIERTDLSKKRQLEGCASLCGTGVEGRSCVRSRKSNSSCHIRALELGWGGEVELDQALMLVSSLSPVSCTKGPSITSFEKKDSVPLTV
jgi:hypothetical protein